MEQKVFFKNTKGEKLCGILSNPSDNRNNLIVILVHGFQSNKNSNTNIRLVRVLDSKKISSFRIDLYGHGESSGEIRNITVSESVDDILKAIEFLKVKGYKKIALLGSSFGGLAGIIASSKTSNLSFLVLKCPVSNLAELERKTNVGAEFYKDAEKNNGYLVAPNIKVPVFIIHGDADNTVPISQSIKISKTIPNCRMKVISGADHRFTIPEHFEAMIKSIINFIIENS